MKSILKTVIFAALITITVPAQNAISYDTRQPLVIVRFSGQPVNYQNSLAMAVSEAVRVKQNVIFDVVAGRNVGAQGSQIAQDIIRSGVSRTNVNLQANNNSFNEVMVFVR